MFENYLYIDTLDHLIIGLLDGKTMKFLQLEERAETKSSGIIHQVIYDIFQQNQMDPLQLAGVIQAAGPGSYTGMRLSHGIVQIFQWQGIKSYGFYHYEVPHWMGVREGVWRIKAFKREVFCYRWNGGENHISLISERKVEQLREDFFTHSCTHRMIKDDAAKFFSYIISHNIMREPYYFRSPELEFRKPKL